MFANFPNPVAELADARAGVSARPACQRPASDRRTIGWPAPCCGRRPFRDRLTIGTYVSTDPKDVTGVLEDALIKVTRAEEIEAKFIRAVKKGIVERRLDRDAITDAVDAPAC